MKVLVETSARHVHLSHEALESLFGKNYELNLKRKLSQPNQFLSEEKVDLFVGSLFIKNVSVLGPLRNECQAEISLTDARKLKANIKIRESGRLEDTTGFVLKGPNGEFSQNYGLIAAKRHIHMSPEDLKEFQIKNSDNICRLKIKNCERSLIFGDVVVRISEKFKLAAHIDTDEANAAGLDGPVCFGEILNY
ncbi:MAG: phosphate propanoyltransferase [Candidatus Improbicoccus pseudotrichonymphae]|uniref:Phosphate propanoyltransferase n=1 Tax=Candidatus Improbicoccus pseudotrichonymphae TaxID=3033792 RepID=A0AA48KYS2_9FIRM|nr:MAG: phosphate propanoyltransferase [Candidatus Improbicoccus pseudotrichonymphae]